MQNNDWSRRDFVKGSALALGTIGVAGRAPASRAEAREMKEMMMTYQEFVGQPLSEIPTPALLIDLDIFEKNMATMRDACKARGHKCRPHGKAHKSPIIAKKQLEYGAQGQCAAKLGEAEVLVNGGISDVLITAPVVGRRKIERLLALHRVTPDIKVVVDSPENINDLSAAAAAKGRKLKVLIEVNIGKIGQEWTIREKPPSLHAIFQSSPELSLPEFRPMVGAINTSWLSKTVVILNCFRWSAPSMHGGPLRKQDSPWAS